MSTTIYNKLIRDRIPQIIQAEGKSLKTRVLEETEYVAALLEKLEEEVEAFQDSQLLEELADVEEVIDAILEIKGWDRERLHLVQKQKAEARGNFKERLFLETVDSEDKD